MVGADVGGIAVVTVERDRLARELYAAVVLRPAADRAAFLAEHSAGDSELQRAVERLLTRDDATGVRAAAQTNLAAGLTVGTYRVEALLGSGGMGVVYRATDLKLHRPVAIKFLLEGLAENLFDASARERFEREAHMASTLNHPHLLTVYDIGEHEGRHYIVTEFIDGGTLDEQVNSVRPPPWRKTVELLTGVADGIAAAHAANILHRDIKPTNILVSTSGYAKLADFGLAKLADEAGLGAARLREAALTKTGAIVGTIDYMSPEQAAGRPLDARSDVFSFGVVLYELLAGRRPFGGATDYDRLQAIVDAEPQSLPAEIPETLRAIVEKAIEKDPADRYQSMRELVVDLRRVARRAATPTDEHAAPAQNTQPRAARRAVRGGVALVVFVLAVAATAWLYRSFTAESPSVGALAQVSPVTSYTGVEGGPSFSPNGDRVAFVWAGGSVGEEDVYVAQIGNSTTPQRLTSDRAPEGVPRWSPDGSQIAFFRRVSTIAGEIAVIPAIGGQERKLQDVLFSDDLQSRSVLAWTPDGERIVYSAQSADSGTYRLYVLTLATGDVAPIPVSDTAGFGDLSPSVSPDGQWLVFTRYASGPAFGELLAQPLPGGTFDVSAPLAMPLVIATQGQRPQAIGWSSDSKLLVFLEGREFRQWIVGREREVQSIYTATNPIESAALSWSAGRARVVASVVNTRSALWRLPLDPATRLPTGPPEQRASSTQGESSPWLSPDGSRLVFTSGRTGSGEIWVADAAGDNPRQVTRLNALLTGWPHWDHDGRRIVFHARFRDQFDGRAQLYVVTPGAAGAPQRIAATFPDLSSGAWAADGEHLYASSIEDRDRVFRVRIADGNAEPLFEGDGPMESRDGKYLIYSNVRAPGIFRRSLEGDVRANPEERLVEDYRPPAGGWAAAPDGIYYTAIEGGTFRAIRFYDYATRASTDVFSAPLQIAGGLTVSPDSKYLWYAATPDNSGSDLALLEFAAGPGTR
jgi:serine/threonine protein kinase